MFYGRTTCLEHWNGTGTYCCGCGDADFMALVYVILTEVRKRAINGECTTVAHTDARA